MREPLLYINIPGLEHQPYITYTWVIMAVFFLVSFILTRRLDLVPSRGQNFLEAIIKALYDMTESIAGKEALPFFPLFAALFLYILVSNWMGLVPGFMSPTSNLNTNAACAVVVFFATHYVGIRKHGVKYLKHFTGPIWWLAPLMVPLEIIGHVARPLSLTVRLFGNIKGEDLVILILAYLIPIIIPIPMMALAIFTSFIQAFIFTLLSMIYIAGALEEAH